MKQKYFLNILFFLVCLTLLSSVWVFKDLLFPFVTSKALFFRLSCLLALPVYGYLLFIRPDLRPSLKNPLHIAVLVFLAINALSGAWGVNSVRSFWGNFERMGGIFYLASLTLFYFYLQLLAKANGRYFQRILKATVFLAGILAIYGMLVAFGLKPFVPDPSLPRISIVFGNPIYVGSFLILPLGLAAFFFFRSELWSSKILYAVLFLIQLWAVYQSGTRGAVVGLAGGVFLAGFLFILLAKNRSLKIYGISIIFLFSIVVGALYINSDKLPNSSIVFRVFKLRDSNAQARLLQWKTAIRGSKDHPLLGVGPENYYVLANLYHNPEQYKYDRSWFDKPHNFLLEILATAGLLGFAAYAAMVIFSVKGFFSGYKFGMLSLPEFLVLIGAAAAYQVQNLFVFDNVSASIVFFLFLAFGGYLLEPEEKNINLKPSSNSHLPEWGLVLCAIGSIWLIYFSVYLPAKAAKSVNYGLAYIAADPQKSSQFFSQAFSLPYNFDFGESAMKYSDLGLSLAFGATNPQDKQKALEELEKCILLLKEATERYDNYPIYFQRLANLYLAQSFLTKSPFPQEGEEAIEKAMKLAPNRTEAMLLLSQIRQSQGNMSASYNLVEKIIQIDPENLDARWILAILYKDQGNFEQAAKGAESLLQAKYAGIKSPENLSWLIAGYVERKEYKKALAIYEVFLKNNQMSLPGALDMAKILVLNGEPAKAKSMGEQVYSQASGDLKKAAEEFLQTLPKTP